MKPNILQKAAACLLIVFAAVVIANAQPLGPQEIDVLVERSMKAFDVPGIAVGVVKDGKVVIAKGYGVRSLNTMQKMDENTLFGIASNSKAFTAAALGILVDEGKIKWDDKVRNHIPEFKLYDPYVTEEFTIRDLLTHRSGLGLGAGDLMFFPDGSDFTLKDLIHNLRYLKPVSSFRSKYDYDNNLYVVAGEVVTRVSGKSWAEFVEDRIASPLGMTMTAATYARLKDKSNVIEGHAPVNGKVRVIERSALSVAAPAGAVNSNVTDLIKWVNTLLVGGKYGEGGSKQLLSPATARELWTPQTILRVGDPGPYNTHFAAYGLGFGLSDVSGYKQVRHTGGLEGMVTEITMIPELNLGIIVLTNQQEGGAFVSISNQIKDAYLGKKGNDWVAIMSERRKKQLADAKVITDGVWQKIDEAMRSSSKIDVEPYTRTYKDVWFGDVSISLKDGKLWFASKRSPKLSGEMLYYKGNTFVAKWATELAFEADAFVSFTLDREGIPSGFTMRPVSPLTDFSYDFQDLDFHRAK